MPTGYTASVVDGEMTELKDFAKLCVRAFGGFIHMRDHPFDAELQTEVPTRSSYYDKEIEELKKNIEYFKNVEDVRILSHQEGYIIDAKRIRDEYREKSQQQNARLEAMRVKVLNWKEADPALRDFMLDQLKISSTGDDDSFDLIYPVPEVLSAEDYRRDRLSMNEKHLERAIRYREESIASHKNKQEWVDAFFKSLETAE